MKLSFFILAVLLPAQALASPFVISDPVDPSVTSCGFVMDATPKQTVPVVVSGTTKICKLDLAGLAVGPHTVTATAIVNDPINGVLESAPSVPLAFTKPGIPSVPANLRLTP